MKISAVKTAYAILVFTGIIYAFVELRGPNGIPGLLEKRQMVHEYEEENVRLHRELEQKQLRIQRLKDSPAEQELAIREKLKFARPGEKVYILDSRK